MESVILPLNLLLTMQQQTNQAELLREHLRKILKTEESNLSAIDYVDFNNNTIKLFGPQRIVVYGRKGTGKTTLLKQANNIYLKRKILPIYIDCKDYSNHTYPDLLIKILITLFEAMDVTPRPFFQKLFSRISFGDEIAALKNELEKPESVTKEILLENTDAEKSNGNASLGLPKVVSVGVGAGGASSARQQEQFTITQKKIYTLEKELENYKKKISKFISIAKFEDVYLLIDEYYYVRIIDQPLVIDYLYRLFFNTKCWMKIATNRYRSQLEEREEDGTSYGITEGEEYTTIDLDFTLEKFSSADEFLKRIIQRSSEKVGVQDFIKWFSNKAFERLVWASGGVPRDFLGLLIIILENVGSDCRIDNKLVNTAAQKYFDEKLSKFDTKYERQNNVRELWEKIFQFSVKLNKNTAFIVEVTPDAIDKSKSFQDLIDARMIHMVAKNITSKTHSGKRFNAYILNMGSYAKYLSLKKNRIKETNILPGTGKGADSPFRYGVPILSGQQLEKIKDMIQENQKEDEEKEQKEREKLRSFAVKAKETQQVLPVWQ